MLFECWFGTHADKNKVIKHTLGSEESLVFYDVCGQFLDAGAIYCTASIENSLVMSITGFETI